MRRTPVTIVSFWSATLSRRLEVCMMSQYIYPDSGACKLCVYSAPRIICMATESDAMFTRCICTCTKEETLEGHFRCGLAHSRNQSARKNSFTNTFPLLISKVELQWQVRMQSTISALVGSNFIHTCLSRLCLVAAPSEQHERVVR